MLSVHLTSNDPNNYSSLKLNTSIGKSDEMVMYRVSQVSTIASFSITTQDDYVMLKDAENEIIEVRFDNHGPWDRYTLAVDLQKVVNNATDSQRADAPSGAVSVGSSLKITVQENDRGLLLLTGNKNFEIIDASHKAKLLLGIYHSKLPIRSVGMTIAMESLPMTCLGNVLYVIARTDAVCMTNARGQEESMSIAFRINEVFYDGFPIVSRTEGDWFIIKSSELQRMEFALVDFQLEPVVLHAPLNMTIQIKSIG